MDIIKHKNKKSARSRKQEKKYYHQRNLKYFRDLNMETHVWHPNTKTDITEYCNWHEAKLCNRGRKMKK